MQGLANFIGAIKNVGNAIKRFPTFVISYPDPVHRILSENPRGLCLVSDELAGWFKNFNRYNNGSESEFWMSVFNHKVAMSDRKSSQSGVLIKSPFLCVIGTIQPKVLVELAGNNRNANGFMERILFVMPAEQPKVKWNRESKTPAFDLAAEWKSVLGTLIDIEPKTAANGEIEPEDVPFTADALDRLFSWQNEVTERCNAERSDSLTSIASKLEIYAVRFCLLLSLADWACGAKKKKTIDAATVGRAIRLTEYFRRTAAQVQGIVSEAVMSEAQLNMMEDLPDKFTTAEGIAAALKNGISERTFAKLYDPARQDYADVGGTQVQIKSDPTDGNKFRLHINGSRIFQWFKDQWQRLKQTIGKGIRR